MQLVNCNVYIDFHNISTGLIYPDENIVSDMTCIVKPRDFEETFWKGSIFSELESWLENSIKRKRSPFPVRFSRLQALSPKYEFRWIRYQIRHILIYLTSSLRNAVCFHRRPTRVHTLT